MIVREFLKKNEIAIINEGEKMELGQPFCCDLLSVVMNRGSVGCTWVTIMANLNTIAVAKLVEASCVILAEGVSLDEMSLKKAQEEGVTVLSSQLPIYETAKKVDEYLNARTSI